MRLINTDAIMKQVSFSRQVATHAKSGDMSLKLSTQISLTYGGAMPVFSCKIIFAMG